MKFPWCLLGASTLPRPPEQAIFETTPRHGSYKVGDVHNDSEKRARMLTHNYNESGSGDNNLEQQNMISPKWRKRVNDGSPRSDANSRIPLNTHTLNERDRNILIDANHSSENMVKETGKLRCERKSRELCSIGVNSNELSKMNFFRFPNSVKDASALVCNLCLVLILVLVLTVQLTEALPSSGLGQGPPRKIAGIGRRISGPARGIGGAGSGRLSGAGYGSAGPGRTGAGPGHGGPEHSSGSCNLITGNAAARAGAAAQVLEAEVATSPEGENKYTAALTVKRVLRRYRGPGRLKKQDVITLTLQRRPQYPCVAVASLEVGKRYFVFLDAPSRRNVAPKAIAAPVPYSRGARRLIRQEVCNKCGDRRPPSPVSRLPKSDSAVRGHSVNFTCVFEGSPLPSIAWYKDDVLIVLDKGAASSSRGAQISDNDVAASDSKAPLNTNTMSITQRRVKSRRLIRRRRRRRRRRQSGLHLRYHGSPPHLRAGLAVQVGGAADQHPSQQRWRHRARWRQWYRHKRRHQNAQNLNDYEDQVEVHREKRDAEVSQALGNRKRLIDDVAEFYPTSSSDNPRIHHDAARQQRLKDSSFGRPAPRNENKTEGVRELSFIRQDSVRPSRLRSLGRDARLSHRPSGSLGNDSGESSLSSRGAFRHLLSLKTDGEIREPRDSLGGRSTAKKRRQKKRKKNKNRRGGGKSSRGTRRIVSSLSIGVVEEDHAGVYKCVATSKKGTAEQQVQLSVIPPLDPGLVYPCPYDSFCLNGGTCMFFKFVGELVCQCVEGFKGQRCQEKEVYPTYTAEHGCRGPLAYLRGSRAGLRCPRNQPLALWQLLQRSLADRRLYTKLYPLAKAEVFDLSVSSEEPSSDAPTTRMTVWQDTPVYNPDTGLLTGPEALPSMSQKPEQWGMGPPHFNASVTSHGNEPFSSQYFVQLQRNRQILRAILALDMEDNLSRESELHSMDSSNSVHDSTLYSAVDSRQYQRRRGMLGENPRFHSNSSDSILGSGDQTHLDTPVHSLTHDALRRAVEQAPLSSGVVHSQGRRALGSKRHRAHHGSRQHRRRDSRTRVESRTWSAHIVLTTEMPRPTLEVAPRFAPAN